MTYSQLYISLLALGSECRPSRVWELLPNKTKLNLPNTKAIGNIKVQWNGIYNCFYDIIKCLCHIFAFFMYKVTIDFILCILCILCDIINLRSMFVSKATTIHSKAV